MRADTSKWRVGRTAHGRDLTDASLRASMASEECIESIAHPILERGEDRKGIVFLPGIEAAEAVAAALNALKPGYATFVHGKVPKKERRRRVRAFEDGEVRVMTGCKVFQEGLDVPDVDLVVGARPTQSAVCMNSSSAGACARWPSALPARRTTPPAGRPWAAMRQAGLPGHGLREQHAVQAGDRPGRGPHRGGGRAKAGVHRAALR